MMMIILVDLGPLFQTTWCWCPYSLPYCCIYIASLALPWLIVNYFQLNYMFASACERELPFPFSNSEHMRKWLATKRGKSREAGVTFLLFRKFICGI